MLYSEMEVEAILPEPVCGILYTRGVCLWFSKYVKGVEEPSSCNVMQVM